MTVKMGTLLVVLLVVVLGTTKSQVVAQADRSPYIPLYQFQSSEQESVRAHVEDGVEDLSKLTKELIIPKKGVENYFFQVLENDLWLSLTPKLNSKGDISRYWLDMSGTFRREPPLSNAREEYVEYSLLDNGLLLKKTSAVINQPSFHYYFNKQGDLLPLANNTRTYCSLGSKPVLYIEGVNNYLIPVQRLESSHMEHYKFGDKVIHTDSKPPVNNTAIKPNLNTRVYWTEASGRLTMIEPDMSDGLVLYLFTTSGQFFRYPSKPTEPSTCVYELTSSGVMLPAREGDNILSYEINKTGDLKPSKSNKYVFEASDNSKQQYILGTNGMLIPVSIKVTNDGTVIYQFYNYQLYQVESDCVVGPDSSYLIGRSGELILQPITRQFHCFKIKNGILVPTDNNIFDSYKMESFTESEVSKKPFLLDSSYYVSHYKKEVIRIAPDQTCDQSVTVYMLNSDGVLVLLQQDPYMAKDMKLTYTMSEELILLPNYSHKPDEILFQFVTDEFGNLIPINDNINQYVNTQLGPNCMYMLAEGGILFPVSVIKTSSGHTNYYFQGYLIYSTSRDRPVLFVARSPSSSKLAILNDNKVFSHIKSTQPNLSLAPVSGIVVHTIQGPNDEHIDIAPAVDSEGRVVMYRLTCSGKLVRYPQLPPTSHAFEVKLVLLPSTFVLVPCLSPKSTDFWLSFITDTNGDLVPSPNGRNTYSRAPGCTMWYILGIGNKLIPVSDYITDDGDVIYSFQNKIVYQTKYPQTEYKSHPVLRTKQHGEGGSQHQRDDYYDTLVVPPHVREGHLSYQDPINTKWKARSQSNMRLPNGDEDPRIHSEWHQSYPRTNYNFDQGKSQYGQWQPSQSKRQMEPPSDAPSYLGLPISSVYKNRQQKTDTEPYTRDHRWDTHSRSKRQVSYPHTSMPNPDYWNLPHHTDELTEAVMKQYQYWNKGGDTNTQHYDDKHVWDDPQHDVFSTRQHQYQGHLEPAGDRGSTRAQEYVIDPLVESRAQLVRTDTLSDRLTNPRQQQYQIGPAHQADDSHCWTDELTNTGLHQQTRTQEHDHLVDIRPSPRVTDYHVIDRGTDNRQQMYNQQQLDLTNVGQHYITPNKVHVADQPRHPTHNDQDSQQRYRKNPLWDSDRQKFKTNQQQYWGGSSAYDSDKQLSIDGTPAEDRIEHMEKSRYSTQTMNLSNLRRVVRPNYNEHNLETPWGLMSDLTRHNITVKEYQPLFTKKPSSDTPPENHIKNSLLTKYPDLSLFFSQSKGNETRSLKNKTMKTPRENLMMAEKDNLSQKKMNSLIRQKPGKNLPTNVNTAGRRKLTVEELEERFKRGTEYFEDYYDYEDNYHGKGDLLCSKQKNPINFSCLNGNKLKSPPVRDTAVIDLILNHGQRYTLSLNTTDNDDVIFYKQDTRGVLRRHPPCTTPAVDVGQVLSYKSIPEGCLVPVEYTKPSSDVVNYLRTKHGDLIPMGVNFNNVSCQKYFLLAQYDVLVSVEVIIQGGFITFYKDYRCVQSQHWDGDDEDIVDDVGVYNVTDIPTEQPTTTPKTESPDISLKNEDLKMLIASKMKELVATETLLEKIKTKMLKNGTRAERKPAKAKT